MQIHRLFEIVYILLEKKNVTAKELAVYFTKTGDLFLYVSGKGERITREVEAMKLREEVHEKLSKRNFNIASESVI
ncbi:MAG: hypothetical protein HDR01_03625 [Lachnospiraceae bacterium]|nr:hypothetical protein [Lachnospiraceae bacterium]